MVETVAIVNVLQLFWRPADVAPVVSGLFLGQFCTAQSDSLTLFLNFLTLFAFAFIKATPTIVGEAFIFHLWTFFLSRTYIAARRRSGAPSKVYQWLGHRCRQKVARKNFANRPPNFYRGGGWKSAKFGLDSQNQSPLTGSSFETEQHIGNLKLVSGA